MVGAISPEEILSPSDDTLSTMGILFPSEVISCSTSGETPSPSRRTF